MSYVTSKYNKQKIRLTTTGRIYNLMFSGKNPFQRFFQATYSAPIYNKYVENNKKEEHEYFNATRKKKKLNIVDLGANDCSFQSKRVREDIKNQNYIRVDIDKETNPYIIADLNKQIPLDNMKFDAVFCISVLEHLHNPQICIDESYRILKPEGVGLFLVPFMYRQHGAPNDFYRFTPFILKKMFKNFKKVEIEGIGGYMSQFAQHFFLGTFPLDQILGLGFLMRLITYPIWALLTKIDKYDKFRLTATAYIIRAYK